MFEERRDVEGKMRNLFLKNKENINDSMLESSAFINETIIAE